MENGVKFSYKKLINMIGEEIVLFIEDIYNFYTFVIFLNVSRFFLYLVYPTRF